MGVKFDLIIKVSRIENKFNRRCRMNNHDKMYCKIELNPYSESEFSVKLDNQTILFELNMKVLVDLSQKLLLNHCHYQKMLSRKLQKNFQRHPL